MLAGPGKKPTPADAVDLLLECHGRIREFLALARRLGEARDAPAEVVTDAAVGLERYFTLALPLHARDEEESVAPRLRGRDPAVDVELVAMAREHGEHDRPLAALLGACAALAREPGRLGELAPTVARASEELLRHFAAHLAREEEVIFPAIRRYLDQAADAAIVKEIRLRRRRAAGEGGSRGGAAPGFPSRERHG